MQTRPTSRRSKNLFLDKNEGEDTNTPLSIRLTAEFRILVENVNS